MCHNWPVMRVGTLQRFNFNYHYVTGGASEASPVTL